MLSLRHCISLAASLAVVLMVATSIQAARPIVSFPAFTKDYHLRDHRSPDGKYLARLVSSEGEAGELTIRRVRNGRPSTIILRREWSVDGALWLPGQAHSLVFGEDEAYGTPMLALWKGGPLHQLVPSKDPKLVGFELRGLATDGRTLLYSQGEDTSNGIVWRRCRVRLPRPAG